MNFLDKLKPFFETPIKVDLSNFNFLNINIGTINKAKAGGTINPVGINEKNQTVKIDLERLAQNS